MWEVESSLALARGKVVSLGDAGHFIGLIFYIP
jgi:hypothetical protein